MNPAEKYQGITIDGGSIDDKNKKKINIVDNHTIEQHISGSSTSTPTKIVDLEQDFKRDGSCYSTSDWASSVSTTKFMTQNTIHVMNKTQKGYAYIMEMLSSRGKLLFYGCTIVTIASVLVRLTLAGNAVAALFLDILNRIHQGSITFVSWKYYMPLRFSHRFFVVLSGLGVLIYAFFHIINFAVDPQNYVANRIYDANDQASTFWRCQVEFVLSF